LANSTLRNCRILAVEDEYLLADELQSGLEDAGAIVIGPAPTVEAAAALVEGADRIDGAILDVNLGGEMSYVLADMLVDRGVPLVFTTGYDASVIPDRFNDVPRCEKPISIAKVTEAIGRRLT
jgi:DNA-binding LytR/AlgR family response regulator